MSIPLIVVWGHRTSLYKLGWTARVCSRCRRVQPFECFDQAKSSHIYYIYGKEKSVGRVLTCDFCESSLGLTMRGAQDLIVDSLWNKVAGLQTLINSTNPLLGQVAVSDTPSQEELFALLESVNERSSPFKIQTGGGFLVGALLGGASITLLTLLLYLIGQLQNRTDLLVFFFIAGFLGAIIGGTVGAIKVKITRAKELAQKILVSSMDRKKLNLGMLKRALKLHRQKLKWASAGLDGIAGL